MLILNYLLDIHQIQGALGLQNKNMTEMSMNRSGIGMDVQMDEHSIRRCLIHPKFLGNLLLNY